MDQAEIIQWCIQHLPGSVLLVLMGLGSLVILGTIVIPLTPSKADDEFLAKMMSKPIISHVLKFLMAFSPIAKKEGHFQVSNKIVLPEAPAKVEEAPKA